MTLAELEAGVEAVRAAPAAVGSVEMIVRRPAEGARELLEAGDLDAGSGLVGDNWLIRGGRSTPDGSAHPDLQLTLMNARSTALIAGPRERVVRVGDEVRKEELRTAPM